MTQLLIKWFVPDAQQVRDSAVRQRYGRLAGGVGIAAMYMIDDNDMLAPILTRCTESMEGFFTGFKADGVCAEGLGY